MQSSSIQPKYLFELLSKPEAPVPAIIIPVGVVLGAVPEVHSSKWTFENTFVDPSSIWIPVFMLCPIRISLKLFLVFPPECPEVPASPMPLLQK